MDEQQVLAILGIESETSVQQEIENRYVPDPEAHADFGLIEIWQWAEYSAAAAATGVIGNMVYDAAKTSLTKYVKRLRSRTGRNTDLTEDEAIDFARYVLACAGEPSELWNHSHRQRWARMTVETESQAQGRLVRFIDSIDTDAAISITGIDGWLNCAVTCEVLVPAGPPDKEAVTWRCKTRYEPATGTLNSGPTASARARVCEQIRSVRPAEFGPWRNLRTVRLERTPNTAWGAC